MAKKFVRGVTGVKDIEEFNVSLTNVNDLISDGYNTYVHTKKGTNELYYNITDAINQVVSSDSTLTISKENDTVSITNNRLATKDELTLKQDKLSAGSGLSISNNQINITDELYDDVANSQTMITLIEEHKKLVKEMITSDSIITNAIYGHHTRDVEHSTNENYIAVKPIQLYAGRTYYIYNAQLYFSKVQYNNGTIELLSEQTGSRSATFTPEHNCNLYLTFTKQTYDSRLFGLSNGKRLWTLWNENNQYYYTQYDPKNYEITVSKDATGDYTRIVDAVNAIPNNSDEQYTIYLNEGVYDLYQELGGETWLSGIQGNRNGLNLINKNVKIVGLGRPTVKLFVPDNLATESTVPNVSVIECAGSVELNNLIVEGKNVRYVIHDETGNNSLYNNTKHVYKNVRVKHHGNKSGTWINSAAIACGMSSGCHYSFINSILEGSNYSALSLHNNVNQKGGTITIDGLKVSGTYLFDTVNTSIRFGYYMQNTPTDIYEVVIKNLISDGEIYVRPESGSVPSTNIYNVTNFTNVNLNIK